MEPFGELPDAQKCSVSLWFQAKTVPTATPKVPPKGTKNVPKKGAKRFQKWSKIDAKAGSEVIIELKV